MKLFTLGGYCVTMKLSLKRDIDFYDLFELSIADNCRIICNGTKPLRFISYYSF